eukprot:9476639-Pyramimonas_sp.AAC.1
MKAPSPKDTKCKFCRRRFTRRGAKEHERHHCAKKSRQEAARVPEEPMPSLRENPAWQWSASPCRS